jgi:hypothetical protein
MSVQPELPLLSAENCHDPVLIIGFPVTETGAIEKSMKNKDMINFIASGAKKINRPRYKKRTVRESGNRNDSLKSRGLFSKLALV